MDDTANWKPDPFGAHELRFFSADGRPTLLVMDGGKKSYDNPPPAQSERPATSQASPDLAMPEPQEGRAPQPLPNPPADPNPDDPTDSAPYESRLAEVSTPAAGPTSHAIGGLANDETLGPGDSTKNLPYVAKLVPVSAESLQNPADDQPQRGAGNRESEVLGRPLKIAYAIVLGVLAVSLLGLVYVHLLHHSDNAHSTLQAAPPTTSAHVTTTSAHATTTTTALPATLGPSAVAAASALVSAWSTNNRSAALEVATPTSVTTLFGVPYTSGLAIDRGCSTSFSPIVCTYGPPGGASPTDPIYQIMVSQAQGGWYVSSVKIEN